MKLNLQATTKEEQKVKAYLEANASEVLAEKINNGVRVQKDGKTLINKKTLAGFMKYACDEAKKQVEKGASSACIDDPVVYGWAVHYFEEASIEGTLYNEDGTEYKAPMPKTKPVQTKPTPPMPKPKPQLSIFDMVSANKLADEENEEPDDEPTDEDGSRVFRSSSDTYPRPIPSRAASSLSIVVLPACLGPVMSSAEKNLLKSRIFCSICLAMYVITASFAANFNHNPIIAENKKIVNITSANFYLNMKSAETLTLCRLFCPLFFFYKWKKVLFSAKFFLL